MDEVNPDTGHDKYEYTEAVTYNEVFQKAWLELTTKHELRFQRIIQKLSNLLKNFISDW